RERVLGRIFEEIDGAQRKKISGNSPRKKGRFLASLGMTNLARSLERQPGLPHSKTEFGIRTGPREDGDDQRDSVRRNREQARAGGAAGRRALQQDYRGTGAETAAADERAGRGAPELQIPSQKFG